MPRNWQTELDRACNDRGDGGVCTWCGELHTVTIVPGCRRCHYPADECRCRIVITDSGPLADVITRYFERNT